MNGGWLVVGLLLVALGLVCTFATGAVAFVLLALVLGVSCELAAYRERADRRRPGPPSDSYRGGW